LFGGLLLGRLFGGGWDDDNRGDGDFDAGGGDFGGGGAGGGGDFGRG
jgi:hypothetical protein